MNSDDLLNPPNDPEPENPTYPKGRLLETQLIGIDENGNHVKLKEIRIYGEWQNGFKGTIISDPRQPEWEELFKFCNYGE